MLIIKTLNLQKIFSLHLLLTDRSQGLVLKIIWDIKRCLILTLFIKVRDRGIFIQIHDSWTYLPKPWMHKCSFLAIMRTALPRPPDIWVRVSFCCSAGLSGSSRGWMWTLLPEQWSQTDYRSLYSQSSCITETWRDGVDHYCHTNKYVQQLHLCEGKR